MGVLDRLFGRKNPGDMQKSHAEKATTNKWEFSKRLIKNRDVDGLINLLKHQDEDMRFEGALGLGEIKEAKGVEPLIHSLKDKSSRVRWRAALSLGEIGDSRAVSPLRGSLKDDDEYVRGYVAEALAKLGDSQPLLSALERDLFGSLDSRKRSNAAMGIATTGTQSMTILLKAVMSGMSSVCYPAARAINQVLMGEGTKVTKEIYEALKLANDYLVGIVNEAKVRKGTARSFDDNVSTAIAALGFIGNSSVLPVLEALLLKVREKIEGEGVTHEHVQTGIAAGYISTKDDILHVETAITSIKKREAVTRG